MYSDMRNLISVFAVRTNNFLTLYSESSLKTPFVITAKFVVTSVWSAQKSADRVFFH